jgi:cytidine deaminase
MKKIRKELILNVYENWDKLTSEDQSIMQKAIDQLDLAYAPYSNFYVGAALVLNNGNIYVGCNQENASYPLCMCGERVALYNAVANEPKFLIKTIAITARNPVKKLVEPISPCGACRQVMLEFELRQQAPIRVLLKADEAEIYEFESVKDLLPFAFNGSFL